MANYNKIILVGNLTRDPQMSYLPSQTAVVEFGMAVNHVWRDQQGNKKEDTCFIDCKCYGKQAETLNQYMSKGRQLLVEGRLQLDRWEDKEGNKRSKHRVFVERFQFIGSGGGGGGGGARQAPAGTNRAEPAGPQQHQGQQGPPSEPAAFNDGPGGDDIPF